MKYNFDYDIVAFIFNILLFVYVKIQYYNKTKSIQQFRNLVLTQVVMAFFDMASAFMGMHPEIFNQHLIIAANTMFFLAESYSIYCFMKYLNIIVYVEKPRRKFMVLLDELPILIYAALFIVNIFTGMFFFADPVAGYQFGPWHAFINFFPLYYFANILFKQIYHRKQFMIKQTLSTIAFIVIIAGAILAQSLFFNHILICCIGCSCALLIILMSLETPDHQKLQQSLEELEIAKNEAMKANQAKSDFLANMSHEIRTPINAVLGLDEMILRESKEKEILDYAAKIKVSGNTLLSLINDILDFSKIESGKMEIIPAEYETKSMIAELIQMIEPRATKKGLTLNCDIDSSLPTKLFGDDVRIRQVITNLLTNAVKYTKEGSVTLSIKTVGRESGNIFMRISVKDTGMGIRKEDQKKLFDTFQRVDEKINRNIEGTGLGLAITTKILSLMNSKLKLESVYQTGSDFYFSLEQKIIDAAPIGEFKPQSEQHNTKMDVFNESFEAPGAKVLVVDDTPMNLIVFKGLTKNMKLDTVTANSGAEALAAMKKQDFDIVFLDHYMPEMDGIETLQRIEEESFMLDKKIPVIALTANAISGAKEMYIEHGFTDFLAKPIVGKDLEAIIREYLPEELIKDRT